MDKTISGVYVRTGEILSVFVAVAREHSPGHIPQVDSRTCREHDVTMPPPIIISRQHRACVTRPSALYCCSYSSCVHRSLRSVIHPLYLALLLLCVRSTLTVDGKVKIVWIKYQYLNCINIYDVLCFFPETHRKNLSHQTTCREHQQHYNPA